MAKEIPLLHSPPCQEIISELSASVSHFSVFVSGSSLAKWLSFCVYDNWLVIKSNRVIKVTHFASIIWNILAHSQVFLPSNNIHHTTEKAETNHFLLTWGLCTSAFPYPALIHLKSSSHIPIDLVRWMLFTLQFAPFSKISWENKSTLLGTAVHEEVWGC